MNIKNAILATIHAELRLIRVETTPKLIVLLTFCALLYGLMSGIAFQECRNNRVTALKESTTGKFLEKRNAAQTIAEGKMVMPDKPYRDPGNTIFVARSTPEIADLPQTPLSFLAVGESDLYPAAIQVSAKSKDSFLFDEEINNPTHLLTGVFDSAFVLVYLLPLFILALTYNIISGEREQGTLSLNAASPVPMRVIMSAKLLVRVAVPLLTAALTLSAAVLTRQPHSLGAAAILVVALLLYSLFWGAVALAVNGFGLDSTGNALVMSILWISLVFIVPAIIDAVVELAHPAPTRSAMVLAVRNSTIQVDTELDAAQAQYQLEHQGTGHTHGEYTTPHTHLDPSMVSGSNENRNFRLLQSIKKAQAAGDAIYQEQQHTLEKRQNLANRLQILSPVLVMQDIFAESAGNGSIRYKSFFSQVDRFHDTWRSFFVNLAEQGIRLDASAYDEFPKFHYNEDTINATSGRIGAGILTIAVYLLVAALSVKLLLNRFQVVGR
jgi:ABC-2 type transport system permease protein